jgi:hypothetical protein
VHPLAQQIVAQRETVLVHNQSLHATRRPHSADPSCASRHFRRSSKPSVSRCNAVAEVKAPLCLKHAAQHQIRPSGIVLKISRLAVLALHQRHEFSRFDRLDNEAVFALYFFTDENEGCHRPNRSPKQQPSGLGSAAFSVRRERFIWRVEVVAPNDR